MTAKRIALRASLLVTLCAVLVPVLATGSASALTRGFSIYNVTGRTLRVDKIDVDGAAPVFEGAGLKQGTLLAPGAKVSLEVFRGFTGGENRIITIRYAPVQYNPEGRYFRITLKSNDGATSCVVPRYSNGTDQCTAGSGSVKMLDPADTVHDVPASDRAQQGAIMANLCRPDTGAECAFNGEPESKDNPEDTASAPVPASGGVWNCTDHEDTAHYEVDHTTSSENSVEVGFEYEFDSDFLFAGAKMKIHANYGHKWVDEKSYKNGLEYPIGPHTYGWVNVVQPVWRYRGDYKITLANTTWNLHDVYWDMPQDVAPGTANAERPMTQAELDGPLCHKNKGLAADIVARNLDHADRQRR